MAFELALVAIALVSSAAAMLSSVVQREDRRFPASPERRSLFGILLLDAALQWVCIARLAEGKADAAWIASFILIIGANLVVGGLLLFRGHAVANLVRWGGVLFCLFLEPAMLAFVVYALSVSGA